MKLFESFKKKTIFKKAGPGRRLCDEEPSSSPSIPSQEPGTSQPKQAPSEAMVAAREAALKRLEANTKKQQTKRGIDRLLEDERQKAMQELKMLDEINKKKAFLEQKYVHPVDQAQLYSCPDFDINESYPFAELIKKIEEKLAEIIDDDLIRGAMLIKNCNNQAKASTCISTLELVLNNLKTEDEQKLEKFKRIKMAKIEEKILNCVGGKLFLTACGFALDETGEWYELTELDFKDQLEYRLDILRNADKATILLDRQFNLHVSESSTHDNEGNNLNADFYNLSIEDLINQQKELNRIKEIGETLMTKAQREKLLKTQTITKHTKLLIEYNQVKYSAMFRVNETLNDLVSFLINQFSLPSFENNKIQFINRVIPPSDYNKTLKELEMTPVAFLHIL